MEIRNGLSRYIFPGGVVSASSLGARGGFGLPHAMDGSTGLGYSTTSVPVQRQVRTSLLGLASQDIYVHLVERRDDVGLVVISSAKRQPVSVGWVRCSG